MRDLVLGGDFRYADDGVLDPTHLRFVTARSIQRLFSEAGYRVQNLTGINALGNSWKRRLFGMATLGFMADTKFKQFAVVATA